MNGYWLGVAILAHICEPIMDLGPGASPHCNGDKRRLVIVVLCYYDTFVKMDGSSMFAERLLYVDRPEGA